MTALSISKAWDQTKATLARDGRLLWTVALALLFLPQVLAGTISPPANLASEQPPAAAGTIVVLALLIGIVGQLAIVRLAIGPTTSVADAIRHGCRRFIWAFVAFLIFICGVAVILLPLVMLLGLEPVLLNPASPPPPQLAGRILILVLIAFFISVKFLLVTPVASAEEVGPIGILKRSWQLTGRHYLKLLAFVLLVTIAALVVVIAAQVLGTLAARALADTVNPLSAGALVLALFTAGAQAALSAVFTVMVACIYLQVSGRAPEASVPSSGG